MPQQTLTVLCMICRSSVMPQDGVVRGVSLFVLFKYCTTGEIWMFVLATLAAFVHGASRPAISLLFGMVLGSIGTEDPDFMSEVDKVAIYMLILSGIVCIVATVWFYLFSRIALALAHRVQRTYLHSVLYKDIAWFDLRSPAEIPTRLSADIDKIETAVASKFGNFVMSLSQAVCGLTIGFTKGWQIALVVCGCLPIIVLARGLTATASKRMSAASLAMYARAGAVAEEVLSAIRTVAAFGQEKRESDRYTNFLRQGRTQGARVAIQVGLSTALMLGSMFACYGIAIYVGALLIENGVNNPATNQPYQGSDIYVILTSCLMSAFALGQIGPSLQAFTEGTAALETLYETIHQPSTIEPLSVSTHEHIFFKMLQFECVSFRYPSRPEVCALNSLSLSVMAGQRVAFVGESGSGKSTIVSLMERFYDPESGEILVNEINVKEIPVGSLRRLFGYVGQEPVMFATSIRDNLVYGLDTMPADEKIEHALKMANVDVFVRSLPDGLDTYCGGGGSHMSGGQKQRIAIARALLRDPQILLLDEATSALDNESEKQVQQTIDEIQTKTSLTTISVAHRLSTIRNSDCIFVFKRGGVLVEQGTHSELMVGEIGLYRSLVSAQVGMVLADDQYTVANLSVQQVEKQGDSVKKLYTSKTISDEKREKTRIATIAKSYKVPYSRLLQFSYPDRWLYLVGLLGAAGKGVAFPVHALLFSAVLAYYYLPSVSEMLHDVSITAIEYGVLAVCVFVAVFAAIWAFAHIGETFTMRIRSECFRHILGQNIAFFDHPNHAPSKLLISLSVWAAKMNILAGQIFSVFVEFFASMIAGLTIAFVASPKLAGILIGTLPLLVLGMVVMSKVVFQGGADKGNLVNSKQAALVASEAVNNMRTIRALTAENATLVLYESYSACRVAEETKKSAKSAIVFGLASCLMFIPYAVGFYVGGKMVVNGEIDMQQMTQVLLGLILTSVGAGSALAYLPDIDAAKAAAHDMFELLDTRSTVDPFATDSNVTIGEPNVTFSNVFFAYPERPEIMILKGLSFSVKAGLKVALVGPSGGGKSTVLAMLLRFYDPISGEVKIGDTDIKNMHVHNLRKLMGYVGQEPVLFDASMEENVRYGNESATVEQIESVAIQAKLDFVNADNVQWTTNLGPKGALLSGGQKQRTAIARALIRNPQILLLDEATSALDSASEAVVQKAIDAATVGRTTFVIAHRLSTIEDADLILVIADGQVVESGTHSALLAQHNMYYSLYRKGTL